MKHTTSEGLEVEVSEGPGVDELKELQEWADGFGGDSIHPDYLIDHIDAMIAARPKPEPLPHEPHKGVPRDCFGQELCLHCGHRYLNVLHPCPARNMSTPSPCSGDMSKSEPEIDTSEELLDEIVSFTADIAMGCGDEILSDGLRHVCETLLAEVDKRIRTAIEGASVDLRVGTLVRVEPYLDVKALVNGLVLKAK